jgi:L-ascorbate metabolism protein UlaG (beta-lactamase superfamily)
VAAIRLEGGTSPVGEAEQAAAVAARLAARWIVPMHYRTPRVGFLEEPEAFLERMPHVRRLEATAFDAADLAGEEAPLAIVPAAP